MEPQKIDAIVKLVPNCRCTVDVNGLVDWLSEDLEQPTEEAIQAKLAELKADYNAKQYQRDRAVAYDPIPEQLDQIYHDIDGWKAKVKAVKDKYPKP